MGAIFGLVGDGSVAELQAMGRRLAHRGPFRQVWNPAPGVYLGQAGQRHFQIDPSSAVAGDCHLVGGEERIPELFGMLGRDALAELRGSFAIALCEGPGRITLAVDQVGYKSLFFAILRGRLAFASEYKALLALPDLLVEPDRGAIQHYLATKQPLHGRSFLARVRCLLPGHVLEWREQKCTIGCYWRPEVTVVDRAPTEHAAVLRSALLETTARQVHPYESVGITLGGGLDAAVVLSAIRHVAPDVRITSFTVGASSDDWEARGARQTAEAFGTEHHEFLFDPETIPSELPRLVWLSEDCGGREEAILQLRVLTEAGARTPVLFGGHGADVLFGGMPRHRLVGLAERLPLLRTPLRELFQLSQAGLPPTTYLGMLLQAAAYRQPVPEVLKVPGVERQRGVFWRPDVNEFIAFTIQRMNSLNYLEPIHESARAVFHSPFLDPDLISTSLTIPGRLKSGWGRQKWVLRKAAEGLLPAAIRHRGKAIQRLDAPGGLATVLTALAEQWLVDSCLEAQRILTGRQLRMLRIASRRAPRNREQIHRLWTVLSLECWARQFLIYRGAPVVASLPD
jgi:asparagine synthase (glutamine-hydrolysing)